MSSNIPRKGDYIVNPNTQRMVKIGSRVWLKLVKQGIVEGHYTDPKKLGKLPDNEEEIEKEIERINKTLPKGQQSVRGRGRYKGKIVSRNKRLAPEEVSKYTTQVATRAIRNNIEAIADYDDDDDIEGMLEKMILAEMMGSSHNNSQPREAEPNAPRARGQSTPYTLYRPKKAQPKQDEYETVAPDEYDYEEVEQHSDGDDYDTSENWEY